MNFEKFSLRETVAKFFKPFKKQTFWMIIASVIVGLILFVVVNIGFAEVVRQNSYDIHMLSSELIIELGPDFTEESRIHANMIRIYTEHLERRYLAAILRLLYPTCSPKKTFSSAMLVLKEAKNEEDAKEAILQAGLAGKELYKLSKSFPRSPVQWFKSEVVSDQLLKELDSAFATSTEMIGKLEKEKTVDAAIKACRANRKAILLLFLARLGFDNEGRRIEHFLGEVKRSRDCTRDIAKAEKDKTRQEWLYEVATSEDRRVKILEAMLKNDIDEVCDLLREAIERAF